MNDKKTPKAKVTKPSTQDKEGVTMISTKADLKTFLVNIRDKMTDKSAAPVYVLSAMNHILNLPDIYELLDKPNKEVARDIWLRLKQYGCQVATPPLLFGEDEVLV